MVNTQYKRGTHDNWDVVCAEGFFVEAGIKAALRREWRRKSIALAEIFRNFKNLLFTWKW